MRRIVVAVVVLAMLGSGVGLVAAGLLGDDGSGSGPYPEPTPEAGSEVAPSPALGDFYGQDLDWQACDDHECATLTVPLDYAKPRGRTIDLALLRVPARAERLGALVVNPGGPGSPGTEYAAAATQVFGSRSSSTSTWSASTHAAPAGALRSTASATSSSTPTSRSTRAPTTPTSARRCSTASTRFGQGCAATDPQLAAHVSTIEAARDMDVLRSALGRAQLDYFGASYGTKLGATYAELFPEQVGRFVLDGAVDVSATSRELSLGQARGFETALRAYVENCVETVDSCYLGDSVDEGLAAITDFLAQVDAQPIQTSDGRQLTVGTSFYGIVTPLYVREYWYVLSASLRAAFDGNGAGLLRAGRHLRLARPQRRLHRQQRRGDPRDQLPRRPVRDQAGPGRGRAAGVPRGLADVRRRLRLGPGRLPRSGRRVDRGADHDRRRRRGTDRGRRHHPRPGDAVRVGGGARRPARLRRSSSRRDGDGHTGYNVGNDCVDDAVEDYLLEGTVPDDGLTC